MKQLAEEPSVTVVFATGSSPIRLKRDDKQR